MRRRIRKMAMKMKRKKMPVKRERKKKNMEKMESATKAIYILRGVRICA